MIPQTLNVLDSNNGFTALINGNTLWRNSASLVNKDWTGSLVNIIENTFFQSDEMDKVKATYKVKGYKYPIVIWFNKTHHRIN